MKFLAWSLPKIHKTAPSISIPEPECTYLCLWLFFAILIGQTFNCNIFKNIFCPIICIIDNVSICNFNFAIVLRYGQSALILSHCYFASRVYYDKQTSCNGLSLKLYIPFDFKAETLYLLFTCFIFLSLSDINHYCL